MSVYRLAATPNREETAVSRLAQDDLRPFKMALLKAITAEVVELETDTLALIAGRFLDVAIGVHLDTIGALLKEGRKGRVDDAYRLALRVVIRARRSAGKVIDFYDVLDLLGLDYHYREWPRAKLEVEVFGLGSYEVPGWIRKIRLAGVYAVTIYSPEAEDETFTLESVFAAPLYPGNLFASVYAPTLGFPLATAKVS